MLQESFVISMTNEKKEGFYVELGTGDPYEDSNTFLIESKFGWKGLSIDKNNLICEKYNLSDRTNKCINADALTFNYIEYFKQNNFPKNIDFLQIDIDGHEEGRCLLALLGLPMLSYRFSVIIIEHDLCRNYKWASMRDAQREILNSLGYRLIVQTPSEDWWVDPNLIDRNIFESEIRIGNPEARKTK